jgi:hypothetical protein
MAERADGGRVFLRLSSDVNERLRAATRYTVSGDLSEYITDALISVDLKTVALRCRRSHVTTLA